MGYRIDFFCAKTYPGSRLHQIAAEESWSLPGKRSGHSQRSVGKLPSPTKYLSALEVLCRQDHTFQVYFNSLEYLDMITRKFGPEIAKPRYSIPQD